MEFRLNEPHPVFFGLFLQECYIGEILESVSFENDVILLLFF